MVVGGPSTCSCPTLNAGSFKLGDYLMITTRLDLTVDGLGSKYFVVAVLAILLYRWKVVACVKVYIVRPVEHHPRHQRHM